MGGSDIYFEDSAREDMNHGVWYAKVSFKSLILKTLLVIVKIKIKNGINSTFLGRKTS